MGMREVLERVNVPGVDMGVDQALADIRKLLRERVEKMRKKRLPDGNVLPNIGNMPIDIYNDALDDILKEIDSL